MFSEPSTKNSVRRVLYQIEAPILAILLSTSRPQPIFESVAALGPAGLLRTLEGVLPVLRLAYDLKRQA